MIAAEGGCIVTKIIYMNYVDKIKKHWVYALVMAVFAIVAAMAVFKQNIQVLDPAYDKRQRLCKSLLQEVSEMSLSDIKIISNTEFAKEVNRIKKFNYNIEKLIANSCESTELIQSQAILYKNKHMNYCYKLVSEWNAEKNVNQKSNIQHLIHSYAKVILEQFTIYSDIYLLSKDEIEVLNVTLIKSTK